MATKSGWQELTTTTSSCPKLFYNYIANENGYQLQLTDLIGLWTAKASARDIRDYAKLTKTSIDPESTSQLQVLLQKLSQGLAEGTSVLKKDESSDLEAVLLETALSLPRPLEPLEWQFHLVPQDARQMAEHILRPCLYEASESSKRIETLVSAIEAKDRVISRLLGKIEGSSMDLSLIFPGITGARARKGQVTVEAAQEHVPGLRAFSRSKWQEIHDTDVRYGDFDVAGLAKLAKGLEDCTEHTKAQHDEWLEKLPKATATTSQVAQAALHGSSSPVRASDTDSDNDFETQKKRRGAIDQQPNTADSSDTKFDLQRPSKRRKPSTHTQPAATNGSRAQSAPGSSPPTLPPQQSKQTRNHSSSSTATELSSDQHASAKRRGRIGHLNSKPKALPARSSRKVRTPSSSPPYKPTTRAQAELLSSSPETLYITKKKPHSSLPAATASNPSPTRRIEQLGESRSAAESAATPERTISDEQEGTSSYIAHIRRLGRIGTGSQPTSKSQHITHRPDANTEIEMQDAAISDSDDSTASTASTSLSPPTKSQPKHNLGRLRHSSPLTPQHGTEDASAMSRLQNQAPEGKMVEPVTEEELTKEEKANRRREELKRKIGKTSAATVGPNTSAGIGLRKKRKF